MKLRKKPVDSVCVHLLFHKREDRGMQYLSFDTRCISKGEIHELMTTNEDVIDKEGVVNKIGFLGFFEFSSGGVLERGDEVQMDGRTIGVVAGFDGCHTPNHYNIIIHCDDLLTSSGLSLEVGSVLSFHGSAEDRHN